MSLAKWIICFWSAVLLLACGHPPSGPPPGAAPTAASGEAVIVKAWQGDYPVARLDRLPEGQHETPVGYIDAASAFEPIWQAFEPSEPTPNIDFSRHLVIFVRNTDFYNRIAIVRILLTDGVAEVLAMETLSAMPIEETAAMAMAVVAREGIAAIQTGSNVLTVRTPGG